MSKTIDQRLFDYAPYVEDWEDGETGEPIPFSNDLREASLYIQDLERKLKQVIVHATNGGLDDIHCELNDICVAISECRKQAYLIGKRKKDKVNDPGH